MKRGRRKPGEWRPEQPAAWLSDSARQALPALLLRAKELRHIRKHRPLKWTAEARAELEEVQAEIRAARSLIARPPTWEDLGHGPDDVPDYLRRVVA